MLVIGRKSNQGVWIGAAHVVVCEILSNKVRLGIEAPPDIVISRDELITGEPVATASKLDKIRWEVESMIATANAELSISDSASQYYRVPASQYYRGQRIAAKRILAILEKE